MLEEDALVRAGQDDQTTVGRRDAFHGRPGTHDPVGRPEWEVVQVLVIGTKRIRIQSSRPTSSPFHPQNQKLELCL